MMTGARSLMELGAHAAEAGERATGTDPPTGYDVKRLAEPRGRQPKLSFNILAGRPGVFF